MVFSPLALLQIALLSEDDKKCFRDLLDAEGRRRRKGRIPRISLHYPLPFRLILPSLVQFRKWLCPLTCKWLRFLIISPFQVRSAAWQSFWVGGGFPSESRLHPAKHQQRIGSLLEVYNPFRFIETCLQVSTNEVAYVTSMATYLFVSWTGI